MWLSKNVTSTVVLSITETRQFGGHRALAEQFLSVFEVDFYIAQKWQLPLIVDKIH